MIPLQMGIKKYVACAASMILFGMLPAKIVHAQEDAPSASATPLETTLAACRDGKDNDKDGHIDCDDQDCGVFVICATTTMQPPVAPPPAAAPEQDSHHGTHHVSNLEMGLQCIDNKDNNNNGLMDCEEPSCQGVEFCLERIYYIPEPADKPMKAFAQLGIGAAFPNWDPPVSEGQEDSAGNRYVVPYLPDVGPLADLTLAYFFAPWVGVGVKGMIAGTNIQSRDEWYEEDYYKFDGFKLLFNVSAVARFQYAFKDLVPYINLLVGYSYVQYRWVTFTRFDEESDTMMTLDRIIEPPSRHLTFAFEVGFDLFIIKRKLAAGGKALLPFAATAGSSMDNTGILLTVTYTPLWPEKKAIRPKYLKDHGIE